MKVIGRTEANTIVVEFNLDEYNEFLYQGYGHRYGDTPKMVKDYREAESLTQGQLAKKVGISRTYLSQIERGEATNLSADIYFRILSVIEGNQ